MDTPSPTSLTRRDLLLLATFCLLFFGTFLCNPQTANVHETVTRQNTREMLNDGDWIVPHLGGRPWLERPPLPFWITAGFVALLGDRDWVYPLPPILLSTGIILLVAWMASVWFGRNVAVMAALILATSHEFYCYAAGTESDIFLCFLVTAALALFVRLEFVAAPEQPEGGFLGRRSVALLAFFMTLGLTNLAKGLAFGTVLTLLPVAGFALLVRRRSIRRYCWLWGWLAFAVVALPWPILVYRRYPDVIDFWSADYVDRSLTEVAEAPWYYLVNLPWMLIPWTVPAAVGLWLMRPRFTAGANSLAPLAPVHRGEGLGVRACIAANQNPSPPTALPGVPGRGGENTPLPGVPGRGEENTPLPGVPGRGGENIPLPGVPGRGEMTSWRSANHGRWFLFLWAALPLALLSCARHKHHHYLLHALVPWAVYGAVGAQDLWRRLQQAPRWVSLFSWRRRATVFAVLIALVCGVRLALGLGEALFLDHYREDRVFLGQACQIVPAERPILVNGDDGISVPPGGCTMVAVGPACCTTLPSSATTASIRPRCT